FGTRARAEYACFPRLKAGRIGMLWAQMIETHQWTQELALGDPELPEPSNRPSRIVNIDELGEEDWGRGDVLVHGRDLGIAAGSVQTVINYNRIEAGMLSAAALPLRRRGDLRHPRRHRDGSARRRRALRAARSRHRPTCRDPNCARVSGGRRRVDDARLRHP